MNVKEHERLSNIMLRHRLKSLLVFHIVHLQMLRLLQGLTFDCLIYGCFTVGHEHMSVVVDL